MFTIEQWQQRGNYMIRFLFEGEPIGQLKASRKLTDDELKWLLDTFTEDMEKAFEDAFLHGLERRTT